jgi:tetratricopeptide (TPR) repeat protein
VTVVALACIVAAVAIRFDDMDLWQHLAYGRALWVQHAVPTTQQWTWPDVGAPELNASWGFRALLWPFWSLGGSVGLVVWRWSLALATFSLLGLAARRMGARGLVVPLVLVLTALAYRQRAQIRPEALAGLLLAAQLWILETRRHGGPDRSPWLVAIAWAWANAHLSYPLGFTVLAIHLGEAQLEAWRGRAAPTRRLWIVAGAAVAISFLNPFGVRALAWPFQFVFQWRHEPMERDVAELAPLLWNQVWRAGVPLLIVGWPLLALSRLRHTRLDRVEVQCCALFTALAVSGHRFVAAYAIVAAPYLARDLAEWAARWRPAWARAPRTRAALATAACVALVLPEWGNPLLRPGLGFAMPDLPVRACDFLAAQGVRGRGMNHFALGGYQVWRFWPDRDRLPFFTIHTEYGTPERRRLYWRSFFTREGWLALDERYRFDYALLRYRQVGDDRLLDVLDADTSWALVFVDDAAAVYVRRAGRLAHVARRFGYRWLGAGTQRLERLNADGADDPELRAAMRRELERQAAASDANASAHTMLAYLAQFEGHTDEARIHYREALAAKPDKVGAHLGLGLLEMEAGRPREAIAHFESERRNAPDIPDLSYHLGRAYAAVGDRDQARRWFRDELSRQPGHAPTRSALEALDRAGR